MDILIKVRDLLEKLVDEYSGNYASFGFAEDAKNILNYVQGALDVLEEK